MGGGKKKIEIKKITRETYRMVTFSKRRIGLFKKAEEVESLTGSRVASVVFSPAGRPYTYGDVNSAIQRHFSGNSGRSTEPSSSVLNSMHYSDSDVVVSGESSGSRSSSTPRRNGFRDWVESIDAEGCENLNKLLMLKEQLEGAKEKIASVEDFESFEALFK